MLSVIAVAATLMFGSCSTHQDTVRCQLGSDSGPSSIAWIMPSSPNKFVWLYEESGLDEDGGSSPEAMLIYKCYEDNSCGWIR